MRATIVATLLLAIAHASSANEAVESTGFRLAAPFYEFATTSRGGWRSQPRIVDQSVGGNASLVFPVASSLGVRLAVGGTATRSKLDTAFAPTIDGPYTGRVGTSISAFQRDSERSSFGLGYGVSFGLAPDTDVDVRQEIALFGALFLGAFDVDAGVAYLRSDTQTRNTSLSNPLAFDWHSNGVQLSASSTWYARDGLSIGLSGRYGHRSSTGDDAIASRFFTSKLDAGQVLLSTSVLPPLGEKRHVALSAWLGYARERTRFDNDPILGPDTIDQTNFYNVGVVVTFILPGVDSLAELRRRY